MGLNSLIPCLPPDPNSSVSVDKQLIAYECGTRYILQSRCEGTIVKKFKSLRKIYKLINKLKINGYNIDIRQLPKDPKIIINERKQVWKEIKQNMR